MARPCATSSRDRATRMLTLIPARVPRDLHLHRLASQRPLEPADLATQLVGLGALLAALQPLRAGRQELLAPLPEHDLGLLLGAELPVLTRVAHRSSRSLERPIL